MRSAAEVKTVNRHAVTSHSVCDLSVVSGITEAHLGMRAPQVELATHRPRFLATIAMGIGFVAA